MIFDAPSALFLVHSPNSENTGLVRMMYIKDCVRLSLRIHAWPGKCSDIVGIGGRRYGKRQDQVVLSSRLSSSVWPQAECKGHTRLLLGNTSWIVSHPSNPLYNFLKGIITRRFDLAYRAVISVHGICSSWLTSRRAECFSSI